MGKRRRIQFPGATYHVYTRGNRRAEVFAGRGDYAAYVEDLERVARQHGSVVLAFCLMPNHTHLCLHTPVGTDPLSAVMQRLNLLHAWRFNLAHSVRGRLNEARYGSQVVDSVRYLKRVVRYIHLNPVKAGLVSRPEGWRYSSQLAYDGMAYPWVSTAEVLALAGGIGGWKQWMGQDAPSEEDRLFEPAEGKVFLAPIEELEAAKEDSGAPPAPRPWTAVRPERPVQATAQEWAREKNVSLGDLASPGRQGPLQVLRCALASDLRRRGYSLAEIAPLVGRKVSATSRLINLARGVSEDEAPYRASPRCATFARGAGAARAGIG